MTLDVGRKQKEMNADGNVCCLGLQDEIELHGRRCMKNHPIMDSFMILHVKLDEWVSDPAKWLEPETVSSLKATLLTKALHQVQGIRQYKAYDAKEGVCKSVVDMCVQEIGSSSCTDYLLGKCAHARFSDENRLRICAHVVFFLVKEHEQGESSMETSVTKRNANSKRAVKSRLKRSRRAAQVTC